MERIDHPIPPLYDGSSRILILGSFPSVKSREAMFFYGHPQNRFWPVLAAVLGCERPTTIEEKKRLALTHHIALWDTIASCEIEGSSDSSIRGVVPNDLTPILRGADIRQIYCNGGTSYQYFRRYQQQLTGREAVKLPSTSPANAAWSAERLTAAWRVILEALNSTDKAPAQPNAAAAGSFSLQGGRPCLPRRCGRPRRQCRLRGGP